MSKLKHCSKCGRIWKPIRSQLRYPGAYVHHCPRLVHPSRRERNNDKRLLLRLAKLPQGLCRDRSWQQVKELVRRGA